MKKLWDLKKVLSYLELEGQGRGIIMGVTRPLLLGPFYYVFSLCHTKHFRCQCTNQDSLLLVTLRYTNEILLSDCYSTLFLSLKTFLCTHSYISYIQGEQSPPSNSQSALLVSSLQNPFPISARFWHVFTSSQIDICGVQHVISFQDPSFCYRGQLCSFEFLKHFWD